MGVKQEVIARIEVAEGGSDSAPRIFVENFSNKYGFILDRSNDDDSALWLDAIKKTKDIFSIHKIASTVVSYLGSKGFVNAPKIFSSRNGGSTYLYNRDLKLKVETELITYPGF